MCASMFAVGSEDLPARVFLTYFTRKSAFKRFGFHPEGTIGLWQRPGERHRRPTAARSGCPPSRQDCLRRCAVTGVQVIRDGETIDRGRARCVVSDIGPAATVKLLGEDNVPADYQDLGEEG